MLRSLKIGHFAEDEKFIEYAFESFSSFPNVINDFYIFSTKKKLKHIRFSATIIDESFLKSKEIVERLNQYDLIVIHFLNSKFFKILQNPNFTSKVLWVGWGGDYYYLIDSLPEIQIFKPETKTAQNRHESFFKVFLKKIHRKKRLKIINRIDYFSPVLLEDYELILKNNKDFKPQYCRWNYGSLEKNYLAGFEDVNIKSNDIMIGNSATATNNHLDVFNIIDRVKTEGLKLYLPLSYGQQGFADYIGDIAVEKYGNKVVILKEFMDYASYINVLRSCGNLFYGHVRQQALGNIITMLYFGAKIFFFEESIAYKYLRNIGVKVFTFSELLADNQLLYTNLNEQELKNTRAILIREWGEVRNTENTRRLLKLLENDIN